MATHKHTPTHLDLSGTIYDYLTANDCTPSPRNKQLAELAQDLLGIAGLDVNAYSSEELDPLLIRTAVTESQCHTIVRLLRTLPLA